MKTLRRLTAIFLAAIALSSGVFFVGAFNIVEYHAKSALQNSRGAGISATALKGVDRQELSNLLEAAFERCAETVDVSHLKIQPTEENYDALASMALDMPLAFCVKTLLFKRYEGDPVIKEIQPQYRYENCVCLAKIAEFKEKASDLTADLVGNDSLTDAEKALLAHDRLALLCEYDFAAWQTSSVDSPQPYTGYGALVAGKAVCSGYALAYLYLMRLLDIPCRLCSSESLNHNWNIVTIGGREYHVDVTLDDPAWIDTGWNLAGEIGHGFFLVSSGALLERQKEKGYEPAMDYDTSPTDTTYDKYYWQNSETAFQLAGGKLYYIDNVAETLKCATDGSVLCSVQDTWYANCDSYWEGNYSRLGGDGKKLYFSEKDAIYEIDPAVGTQKALHAPKLDDYRYIYGFAYDEGWLIYDTNNSPNFNVQTMKRFRVYLPPPKPAEPTELVLADGSSYTLGNYVDGITPLSTAADVKAQFANADLRIRNKAGAFIGDTDFVGTGFAICCFVGGKKTDGRIAVVRGDLNGDGDVNAADYVSGKMVLMGKAALRGEFEAAFDLNSDGLFSSADVAAMMAHIAG